MTFTAPLRHLSFVLALLIAPGAFADGEPTSQPSGSPVPWVAAPELNGLPIPIGYALDTTLVPTAQTVAGSWRVDAPLTITMLGHLLDQGDLEELRELAALNGRIMVTFIDDGTLSLLMQMGPENETETQNWVFVSGQPSQATITVDEMGTESDLVQLWFLDEDLCILQPDNGEVLFYLRRVPQ
jgi:hypothetical protein